MTDKTATERLRELLDERGVEWRETVNHANCVFTWWESPIFGMVHAMDNEDGKTLFMACLNNIDFTPEQAIAAMLGGGKLTAEQVEDIVMRNCEFYEGGDVDAQAIADELNATLGSGECGMIPSFTEPTTLNDCQEFCCSVCGEYMVLQQFPGCLDDTPNFCPNCGRKAVKR